MAYGYGIIGLN